MNLVLGQHLSKPEFIKLVNRNKIVRVEEDNIYDFIFRLFDGAEIAYGATEDGPEIIVHRLPGTDF